MVYFRKQNIRLTGGDYKIEEVDFNDSIVSRVYIFYNINYRFFN